MHADDVGKQMPRGENFLREQLRHFAFKNGEKLQQKVYLRVATSEPADEEDLLTFSLGLEFLILDKKKKKKKTREN